MSNNFLIPVMVKSGTVPHLWLNENTWHHLQSVIIDAVVWNMCLLKHQVFPCQIIFSVFGIVRIGNFSILFLRLACTYQNWPTTNTNCNQMMCTMVQSNLYKSANIVSMRYHHMNLFIYALYWVLSMTNASLSIE